MKLGEQIDFRPVRRPADYVRFAKKLRRRAVRQAWKQRGEVVPNGRYHGWIY